MKNWHFTFKMVEKTFVWPKLFKHTLARYISQQPVWALFLQIFPAVKSDGARIMKTNKSENKEIPEKAVIQMDKDATQTLCFWHLKHRQISTGNGTNKRSLLNHSPDVLPQQKVHDVTNSILHKRSHCQQIFKIYLN